ncbi:S-layer homology domain-containing protein [Sporosarcina sp. Te-1]|uniref:S-layer homology domain-containing protein n=1 Tax=Sporosarcina sp. Te-1 TaxID=2818390 RepID=UPI001A9DB5F1|nr:S-layer homology domain-containing protein [Sporosarcina sp. Te-1]QTD41002.1 S-layer homology domain-containing protein [Sporosarcina sp. Te-1]
MKQTLLTISAFLFISLASPFQADAKAAGTFPDISEHWAKREIEFLYERHIIGGYSDGMFKPDEPITRAQAAAMLVKALDLKVENDPTIRFKDVKATSPYMPILAVVNEKGILRGEDGYMRPGEATTRAQMAAIIRRSFKLPLDSEATFVDVTPAHWAYQDINGIAKQRIAGGDQGRYKPAQAVTRAHFSAFLARAMDDTMKLSSYKTYVGKKGISVEQNGFAYSIEKIGEPNFYRSILVKRNLSTGTQKQLLSKSDLPPTDVFIEYLKNDFPIVVYNQDIYIPYWYSVGEMSETPSAYSLIKTTVDGEKPELINTLMSASFRNFYVWNDRFYYTNEKNKARYFDDTFNEKIFLDAPLILYSTAMDGTDKKKEFGFDARVIFQDAAYSPKHIQVSQNNKSVAFDHSTMYYFNKTGVYEYSLLTRKTRKLSTIQAKDMKITDSSLEITDSKGKSHKVKK